MTDESKTEILGNATGVHNHPPLHVGGELETLYPLEIFFTDRESRMAFAAIIQEEIKRLGRWKYGHITAHKRLTTDRGE